MEARKTACPCCGEEHTYMSVGVSVLGEEWKVECPACGEVFGLGTNDTMEAIRRWNAGKYDVTA